jgi:hypothetical protein
MLSEDAVSSFAESFAGGNKYAGAGDDSLRGGGDCFEDKRRSFSLRRMFSEKALKHKCRELTKMAEW